MPEEIKALAMTGMLGTGFQEDSFRRALTWDPDFIGCDAGSTDSGPGSLGTGRPTHPKEAVKRDLRLGVLGALEKGIPLLVGSAGSAGGDANLARTVEITEEIAREEGLHFRLAVIHAEQDKEYLKRKLAEGRITPLKPPLPLDENVIDRSEHIVGMMGAEPFARALEEGAEVVIAGRSSDTSIYAAIPLRRGYPAGPVWHAAKILECGAACVEYRPRGGDCMFARIGQEYFVTEPPNLEYACTPVSVAAHTFYETESPIHLYEPTGMLDTSTAVYEAETDRIVRVSGSQFAPADRYRVKLEGAEKLGYQSICLVGVRDPVLIGQIDSWLDTLKERVRRRVRDMYGEEVSEGGYTFNVRVYGKNGVLGDNEPQKDQAGHELGLVLETTAPTQEMADATTSAAAQYGLHQAVPGLKGGPSPTSPFRTAPNRFLGVLFSASTCTTLWSRRIRTRCSPRR